MEYNNSNPVVLTSLAVDLGGTKLLVGEVDENGKVLGSKRYCSVTSNQKSAIESIISAINDYRETIGFVSPNVSAIGAGVIGRVDNESGMWMQMDPRRTDAVPVSKILSDYYGIPCAIDNDVRCAVTAENILGWGRKSMDYIYINIGTGIAASFVVDGRLVRGASCNAGEVGHHVVYRDSTIECECGRKGCVEAIASGLGMDLRARKLKPQYPDSPLHIPEGERCDVREIFSLADKGDPLCRLITDDAADAVSNTIMNLVRVSDPDTVILGGGVVSDGWLLSKITERLNSTTMRFVKNGVVLTELNPDYIGLIGAGIVGLEYFRKLNRKDSNV